MSHSAYLKAMGITQWVLRDSPSVQTHTTTVNDESSSTHKEHPVHNNQTQPNPVMQGSTLTEPASESPSPYELAALPSFPSNSSGRIAIICFDQSQQAYHGETASLFDKMMLATQWPAHECVFVRMSQDWAQTQAALSPQLVVCMGQSAMDHVLGSGHSLEQSRGSDYTQLGTSIVVTYHPEDLIRNASLKRPLWEDLKKAMSLLD